MAKLSAINKNNKRIKLSDKFLTSSLLINFAATLIFIVASSTTVPNVRSPSATTIVVAPPLARIPPGEQLY